MCVWAVKMVWVEEASEAGEVVAHISSACLDLGHGTQMHSSRIGPFLPFGAERVPPPLSTDLVSISIKVFGNKVK